MVSRLDSISKMPGGEKNKVYTKHTVGVEVLEDIMKRQFLKQ